MVKALGAHDLTNVNGTLFFASGFSPFSTFGSEKLWKSDGTAAGTVGIRSTGNFRPSNLTAVGSTLFFTLPQPGPIGTLWRSDGTAAGTVQVKAINPEAGFSFPSNLTNVNGTLFFTAFHGGFGTELWKSDGTA